jgi:hypothetical protein
MAESFEPLLATQRMWVPLAIKTLYMSRGAVLTMYIAPFLIHPLRLAIAGL